MAVKLYVDVVTKDTPGGPEYVAGGGPLVAITKWSSTAKMDRAGSFSFELPANSPNVSNISRKRIVRCYAVLESGTVEVGSGIIDSISYNVEENGTVMMVVAGDDMARELTYRSVLNLALQSSSAPITHSASVTAVTAFSPSGWSFTADPSPGNNNIYHTYSGESVLTALAMLAEMSRSHFSIDGFRQLVFKSSAASSGIHAVRGTPTTSTQTAFIKRLRRSANSYDLITRIYPYGAGIGESRLDLRYTLRTAVGDYVLDIVNNCIRNATSETIYGRIERTVQFNEVRPKSNSAADMLAAANMLFDVALYELMQAENRFNSNSYEVELLQCPIILKPLTSIVVTYFDSEYGLNINDTLWIVESTTEVDAQGIRTTKLVVSDQPVVQKNVNDVFVEMMTKVNLAINSNQLIPGHYSIPFTANVDLGVSDTIYIPIDTELTTISSCYILYKLNYNPAEWHQMHFGVTVNGGSVQILGSFSPAWFASVWRRVYITLNSNTGFPGTYVNELLFDADTSRLGGGSYTGGPASIEGVVVLNTIVQ